jgi:hypothetical protein
VRPPRPTLRRGRVSTPKPWRPAIPGLDGEYAFGVFGTVEANRKTGVMARFSLAGDPVTVTRTILVEDVTPEGGAVTGSWTFGREDDGASPQSSNADG